MQTLFRRACALAILLALWTGAGTVVRAQSVEHSVVELNSDLRTRVAGVGKSRTALYDSSARITAALAPGLKLNLYAGHRFGNFLAQQATLEKAWGTNHVQVGMVRLPFGIYDTRETYASGLIDYPMPRSDYAFHSVDWGTTGVSWSGGSSNLQVDAAYFNGNASGLWGNTNPVGGGALRAQTYVKGVILGVSHWDGYSSIGPGKLTHTDVHVTGVDWRFTRPHLLVRGEYLVGNFGPDNMQGVYIDVYYHLPKYEKITLVGRLEALKPGSTLRTGEQGTLGVRYAATPQWTLAVNWRHNNGPHFYAPSWTPLAGRSGDFLFQAYHKIHF